LFFERINIAGENHRNKIILSVYAGYVKACKLAIGKISDGMV
jgi:hypothetical protein